MKTHFFIHIPKTGGTAIRLFSFLEPMVQDATPDFHISQDYTETLHQVMEGLGDHHGDEHARYRDLNPYLVQGMKKFAIVRNPWDRVASRYFFAQQLIREGRVDEDYVDVSSFEAFIDERWKWGHYSFMWHRAVRGWYPAIDYVIDKSGSIVCDILRFENFNQDVQNYFNFGFDIPKRNVSPKIGTYRDIYTSKTIQAIADWYAVDIDTFGYDFDSGPTRNVWALQ